MKRLRLSKRCNNLPLGTLPSAERQRVIIARGFIHHYPILLLDDPTASLDAASRDHVIDLIHEAKERGTAIIGIFHDKSLRNRVTDREIDIEQKRMAA